MATDKDKLPITARIEANKLLPSSNNNNVIPKAMSGKPKKVSTQRLSSAIILKSTGGKKLGGRGFKNR